jgi:hypothetical protein
MQTDTKGKLIAKTAVVVVIISSLFHMLWKSNP